MRGAELEDRGGILNGHGKAMRYVELREANEAESAALKRVLRRSGRDSGGAIRVSGWTSSNEASTDDGRESKANRGRNGGRQCSMCGEHVIERRAEDDPQRHADREPQHTRPEHCACER